MKTFEYPNEVHPAYPGSLSAVWNLPASRNSNFTGREELLSGLRNAFLAERPGSSIQAIKGMDGVGKTHIAIEYAYRHATDYQVVWWVRSDDKHHLTGDFAAFANSVGLRKQHTKNNRDSLSTVRAWLEENKNWLLIFDDVIKPKSLRDYLPKTVSGHILITSRHQQWEQICPSIQIGSWSTDESVAYLVKRTGDSDPLNAKRIADALKGLPLALEQAAATMVVNNISYIDYLNLYQTRWDELWKGKSLPLHYPDTIGTTLSLAVEKIQVNTQMGVLVLSLCAYVAPENVPRSMINAASACMPEAWSALFNDASAVDEAIELLSRYALVSVRLDHLSIHRLVQMAVRGRLHRSKQQLWSEIALLSSVNMLPDNDHQDQVRHVDAAARHAHVRTAVAHAVENDVHPKTVTAALHRLALFLQACGWHETAEDYFRQALEICESHIDTDSFTTALITADLAGLLHDRGAYAQAEVFYRQALQMVDASSNSDHTIAAICLNNLALSQHSQHQFVAAERSLRKALDIHEAQSPTEAPLQADIISNLALVLQDQGKYSDAEAFYRNALNIRQTQFGKAHFDVASSLADLAGALQEKDQYVQAEPLYRQALDILESLVGPDHPRVADNLHSLASLFHDQAQYSDAEPLYRRALAIYETQWGDSHLSIAVCLNNLARLLHDQANYVDAEPLYRRALAIYETQKGNDHPSVAICLNNLARLLHDKKNYANAEPLYQRTLSILDAQFGNDHPDFIVNLNNLKELLSDQGRSEDACKLLNPPTDNDPETG